VAGVVTLARLFYLDDIGAQVGQHLGAPGAGQDAGEVQDLDVGKGGGFFLGVFGLSCGWRSFLVVAVFVIWLVGGFALPEASSPPPSLPPPSLAPTGRKREPEQPHLALYLKWGSTCAGAGWGRWQVAGEAVGFAEGQVWRCGRSRGGGGLQLPQRAPSVQSGLGMKRSRDQPSIF
jgi:hypothetical protein